MDRIAEIEKRCKAATEGPWQVDGKHVWVAVGSQECCGNPVQETDDGVLVTGEHCCGQPVVRWEQVEVAQSGETDIQFIAHARADIPYLIEQLRAAQAEVQRCRLLHESWRLENPKSAQAADEAVVACADCRLAYCDDGWADFVVPHDVWALLTATDNASLLCANCMVRRAVQLGITAVGCFTSGPFAQDFKALATQARGVGEAERQLLRRWLDAADKGLWRDRAGLSLARHPVADDTRAMIAAALRTPATGGGS